MTFEAYNAIAERAETFLNRPIAQLTANEKAERGYLIDFCNLIAAQYPSEELKEDVAVILADEYDPPSPEDLHWGWNL